MAQSNCQSARRSELARLLRKGAAAYRKFNQSMARLNTLADTMKSLPLHKLMSPGALNEEYRLEAESTGAIREMIGCLRDIYLLKGEAEKAKGMDGVVASMKKMERKTLEMCNGR